MKRILIVALVGVLAFSAVAFAGWNFGAKQSVDIVGGNYPLGGYVGYNFEALFIDEGPLSIAGGATLTRADLWPWGTLSGITDVDADLKFSYIDDADIVLSTNASVDFAQLPGNVDLLAWTSGVEVVGHINKVLDISAGFDLLYRLGPKEFTTTFFFGFDAEW